jgi:hypothetical protein
MAVAFTVELAVDRSAELAEPPGAGPKPKHWLVSEITSLACYNAGKKKSANRYEEHLTMYGERTKSGTLKKGVSFPFASVVPCSLKFAPTVTSRVTPRMVFLSGQAPAASASVLTGEIYYKANISSYLL